MSPYEEDASKWFHEENPVWPVWIVRDHAIPAQVWIRQGITDPTLLTPEGKMFCSTSGQHVPVRPGVASVYVRDSGADADGLSATMLGLGPMGLRRKWFGQCLGLLETLTAEMIYLGQVLEQQELLNLPQAAREVDDTATLLAESVARLSGWIAIEGGPKDPLCDAWDNAPPDIDQPETTYE